MLKMNKINNSLLVVKTYFFINILITLSHQKNIKQQIYKRRRNILKMELISG